ncbi:hypothetical protein OAE77_00520, partial [bacterium]|nr:hypothetical protein [bacterium]
MDHRRNVYPPLGINFVAWISLFSDRSGVHTMDLIILRCVFLLCAGGVSAIINASLNAENSNEAMP